MVNEAITIIGIAFFIGFLIFIFIELRKLRIEANMAKVLRLREQLREDLSGISKSVDSADLKSLINESNERHRRDDTKPK